MRTGTLKHSFTKIRTINGRTERTTITITLDDDCRNGHEDFSLTADIEEKDGRGRWVDAGGGCCHDHILEIMPELKPFADLHLCAWEGIPMHAAANGWYWLQGVAPELADHCKNLEACHGGTGSGAKSPTECRRIFGEHFRVTDAEIDKILSLSPRSEKELQIIVEDMGLPARWREQAAAAIAQLEQWTGAEFESKATRQTWKPVSKEDREVYQQRLTSGYYSPEQVASRDAAAAAERKATRIAEILADHKRESDKAIRELKVKLYIAERFDRLNCIYYTHTNELSFNWSSLEKLVTRDEFDAFVAGADLSALPDGIKFEFRDVPKY